MIDSKWSQKGGTGTWVVSNVKPKLVRKNYVLTVTFAPEADATNLRELPIALFLQSFEPHNKQN